MILVTGATGFIGSAVTRRLIRQGYSLRLLRRPNSNRSNIDGLDAEVVEGDLLEPESLKRAVRGCRAVFHVAADYRLWTRHPEAMMRTNVDGTTCLMRACLDAGVERIVYTSSVATLGLRADGKPADESTPVALSDMVGPYKRSKLLAEQAVGEMCRDLGLPAVIVNPSTPMGPRDIKPTPTGRILVEAALGRMPAYVDTGLNVVHVDDVAEGHWLAFERGRVGERYVLGGTDMSLREILQIVARWSGHSAPRFKIRHDLLLPVAWLAEAWARTVGRDEPFVTVDGLRMAKKKMYFSWDKAANELGYEPRSASDAIRDALRWFRDAGYIPARSGMAIVPDKA